MDKGSYLTLSAPEVHETSTVIMTESNVAAAERLITVAFIFIQTLRKIL